MTKSNVILRVVGTNKHVNPRYAKGCCHKHWDDPTYWKPQLYLCFHSTMATGYCTQEADLSQKGVYF